jgi:quinol monooxygenase YgiN
VILVHGTIPIRPDCREEALKLARGMTDATRAEPGCISYDFYVGLSDPNTLMLFQEWESMEALMRHFQTPHMEEFLRLLPTVVSGEIITRRYAVQSVDDDEADGTDPSPVVH